MTNTGGTIPFHKELCLFLQQGDRVSENDERPLLPWLLPLASPTDPSPTQLLLEFQKPVGPIRAQTRNRQETHAKH